MPFALFLSLYGVVTDTASQAAGEKISLIIEALDQDSTTGVYATATTNVTLSSLNNYTLQIEGTPNNINSFIASNHIYYHPTLTIGRVHLEAIADDLGNTPYGPSALPQLATNLIQINFVSP